MTIVTYFDLSENFDTVISHVGAKEAVIVFSRCVQLWVFSVERMENGFRWITGSLYNNGLIFTCNSLTFSEKSSITYLPY